MRTHYIHTKEPVKNSLKESYIIRNKTDTFLIWCIGVAGLTYLPVTQKTTGSNPVYTAFPRIGKNNKSVATIELHRNPS